MSQTLPSNIFISYRRKGGIETAKLLHDQLLLRGHDVFLDLESMRSCAFNQELLRRIETCTDFVLVLSPGALDRCEEEQDWVRQEVAHALKSRVHIVPVIVPGFDFPKDLPKDIQDIRWQNGPTINYEYFTAFIDRLESFLVGTPERRDASSVTDSSGVDGGKRKQPTDRKKPRKALIIGLIAAILTLCLLIFILPGKGEDTGDEQHNSPENEQSETRDDTQSDLNQEQSLPAPQVFGNSPANLCNLGLCTDTGANSKGASAVSNINYLGDWVYWFSSSKNCVLAYEGDSENIELRSLPDLSYLSVSTDWFWYVRRVLSTGRPVWRTAPLSVSPHFWLKVFWKTPPPFVRRMRYISLEMRG